MRLQLVTLRLTYWLKHIRIVQEAYVYATAIRTFQQNGYVIAVVLLLEFLAKVMQATYILYLRHTHTCSTTRVFIWEFLSSKYAFDLWGKPDADHTIIRICTSWATDEDAVGDLIISLQAAAK